MKPGLQSSENRIMVALSIPDRELVEVAIVIPEDTTNYPPNGPKKPSDLGLPWRDGVVLPRTFVIQENQLRGMLDGNKFNHQSREKMSQFKMKDRDLKKLKEYTMCKYINVNLYLD
jgi:hypothetical protein